MKNVSTIVALVAVVSMLWFCSGCGRRIEKGDRVRVVFASDDSRIVEYGDGKYGVQTWQTAGWHDVGRVPYPTLERAQEVKRLIECEDVNDFPRFDHLPGDPHILKVSSVIE